MKKILISLSLLTNVLLASGQHEAEFTDKHNTRGNAACDTRAEIADSSVSYSYNTVAGTYSPESVIQYFYDDNLSLNLVISKTLPERVNIYRQIFQYDHNDLMIKYIYQIWVNDEWTDNLITEKNYTSDGLPETEVFIRENAEGFFVPYQRHFYVTENGRVVSYLRQVKDASGNWYDFSNHFYVYDSEGRLTVLYGKYFNSDLIYWERTSFYDLNGNIAERYLKQLKYDPATRTNILTNKTLQKYHYNIYGDADTIYNYSWSNQGWDYTGKNIGYFSLLKGKKVSICHNGNNLCVAAEAVKAHLEHGDKLGSCQTDDRHPEKPTRQEGSGKEEKDQFILYPNPAGNSITIRVAADSQKYHKAIIASADGKVMAVYNVEGKHEINADLSGFRNGTYYIKMQKKEGFDTRAFIKN